MFDRGDATVAWPDDGDYIKPAGVFEEPAAFQEFERRERESPLFLGGNGLGGVALAAGLDLDEDEDIPVTGDEVNLSAGGAETVGDHTQTGASQVPRGETFARLTEDPVKERPHEA